jgi:hypothetical protein
MSFQYIQPLIRTLSPKLGISRNADIKRNESSSTQTQIKLLQNKLKNGPNLKNFIQNPKKEKDININEIKFEEGDLLETRKRSVYFEVYGCQMNVSDTEVAYSILNENGGYVRVNDETEADVVLLMTCSIREGAEKKIWKRLDQLNHLKAKNPNLQIGILGCELNFNCF